MFGEGRNQVFNLVTLLFVLLTVACLALTAVFATGSVQVPFFAPQTPVPPTVAFVPSATNTYTPLPPTLTFTPSHTPTPSSTPTLTVSVTASLTITPTPGPTDTPSITPSASATSTETPTETWTPSMTPTGPTPTYTPTSSPFPYNLRGTVLRTPNAFNTAGCAWQGIGGQVFDLSNNGVTGLSVRVSGPGLGEGGSGVLVATGSNTLYGPSGWEVAVASQTNAETYYVELLSPQGTQLSPTVQVTFTNNCSENLARVTFEQTRPY